MPSGGERFFSNWLYAIERAAALDQQNTSNSFFARSEWCGFDVETHACDCFVGGLWLRTNSSISFRWSRPSSLVSSRRFFCYEDVVGLLNPETAAERGEFVDCAASNKLCLKALRQRVPRDCCFVVIVVCFDGRLMILMMSLIVASPDPAELFELN